MQYFGRRDADEAEDMKSLLGTVASYLPVPWLNRRILEETRNWESVWNLLKQHYEILPDQTTFIKYKDIKKRNTERPWDLYCRMEHHMSNHLAPGDEMTDTVKLKVHGYP